MRLTSKDKKVFVYVVAKMDTRSRTVIQNLSSRIRRKKFTLLQQGKKTNKAL